MKRKLKEHAQKLLKPINDDPAMWRHISLKRNDFDIVREYLNEHPSLTEFKYKGVLIKVWK